MKELLSSFLLRMSSSTTSASEIQGSLRHFHHRFPHVVFLSLETSLHEWYGSLLFSREIYIKTNSLSIL